MAKSLSLSLADSVCDIKELSHSHNVFVRALCCVPVLIHVCLCGAAFSHSAGAGNGDGGSGAGPSVQCNCGIPSAQ